MHASPEPPRENSSVRLVLLPVLAALLAACSTTPPPAVVPAPPTTPAPVLPPPAAAPAPVTAVYRAAGFAELPQWPGEGLLASWPAFTRSCTRLAARPAWTAACADAAALLPGDDASVQAFFERHFQPWRITSSEGNDTGLVTGYYEALLKGSLEPKPGSVPLHAVPDDMLVLDLADVYPETKGLRLRGRVEGRSVKPYWSRADIVAGKGPGADKVLAWADDAIDAFFLQVQGSGRLELPDGRLLRVGYADQNGRPYRAIGKWLVEQGLMAKDEVTMQSIRAWAEANPGRVPELLNANPSYVFFRLLPDTGGGPLGALNVPLTDGASIAVDPRFIPLGSPVYLDTTRPDTGAPLQRLVHAQDTGGAIRGPVRADFFWGYGHDAAALAGLMKQRGALWLLWPRGEPLPGQALPQPPAPPAPSATMPAGAPATTALPAPAAPASGGEATPPTQ